MAPPRLSLCWLYGIVPQILIDVANLRLGMPRFLPLPTNEKTGGSPRKRQTTRVVNVEGALRLHHHEGDTGSNDITYQARNQGTFHHGKRTHSGKARHDNHDACDGRNRTDTPDAICIIIVSSTGEL